MIHVAVIGHSIDSFSSNYGVLSKIDDIVVILSRQYKEQVKFLVNCEPGIGQWFADACIRNKVPYEAFISSVPEEHSKYWTEEQRETLTLQLDKAKAIRVCDKIYTRESTIHNNYKMIKYSQWVLAFWNGKHQGNTYNAIQHAIEQNKIVLDALNDFKMVLHNS
jgi:uncharacterized phage-like protein YoqJ